MLLPFTDGLTQTWRCDPECAELADRHYSRQTIGAREFIGNGRPLVLRDAGGLVVFAWLWCQPELRMDRQQGYNCTIFRNESTRLSSDIILEAERYVVASWGPNRAFTYIDASKVRSVNPGYCFKQAGWQNVRRPDGTIWTSGDGKHLLEKELLPSLAPSQDRT